MFIEEFELFLDDYISTNVNSVIIGDINVHYDVKSDLNTQRMCDILNIRNLFQLCDKPTHVKGHILDWLITSDSSFFSNLKIADMAISDHFTVSFNLNIPKPPVVKKTILSRNIKKIIKSDFCADLEMCNTVLCHMSPNAMTEAYSHNMSQLIDRHAPRRSRAVSARRSAPWMNDDIKAMKAERRRAEREFRKTNKPEDRTTFHNIHLKLNDMIKCAKSTFYDSFILSDTTSKALFKFVSKFYNREKLCILPSTSSAIELAERFSSYFIEKIQIIRNHIDSCTFSLHSFPCSKFNGPSMSDFRLVSNDEVAKFISHSSHTSCNLDPMPTPLLVENIDCIIESITILINNSLLTGVVPSSFKHAIVNPLLKKKDLDPEILKNYRPVSNLSFISKVLEKVVASQINEHISKNSLLELNQSAYRKLHNTETALLKIFNDLLMSADDKKVSILVLLDLSAAFDTLDHSILLDRLNTTFGLSGTVLEWFKSYLINRTQSVIIDDVTSEPRTLLYGVPQGSVLGPICYTLYTTPLGELIRNHNMPFHMYADDTQLYISIEPDNIDVLVSNLELCLNDIRNWMLINKLKLNEEKTEIILCNPKKFDIHISSLKFGDEVVNFSNSGKNLGVIFDEKLNMNEHITSVSKTVYSEIRRLKQVRNFITSKSSLQKLASSFILSRLDYCNSLFSNLPDKELNKLQKLQNYAARVILKKPIREHAKPLLRDLHWLPINARVDYKICVLIFKCLNGLAPAYLSNLVSIYKPSRNLRSSKALLLTPVPSNFVRLGDRAFSVYGPKIWKKIPSHIKSSVSLNVFKSKLKTYFFENQQ